MQQDLDKFILSEGSSNFELLVDAVLVLHYDEYVCSTKRVTESFWARLCYAVVNRYLELDTFDNKKRLAFELASNVVEWDWTPGRVTYPFDIKQLGVRFDIRFEDWVDRNTPEDVIVF